MALQRIQEAVKSSAQKEADMIVRAAQRNGDERIETEQEAAKRNAERQYQAVTRAIEEDFGRKLLQVKGANGKELLDKRNALLGKIFDLARKQIIEMEADEYVKLVTDLLERAAGDRGGKLRVHADDQDVFERVLARFNANRSSEAQVEVDESRPLSERGGFIFVTDTFEVDQTVGTLLIDMEHELTPRIAADLFKE